MIKNMLLLVSMLAFSTNTHARIVPDNIILYKTVSGGEKEANPTLVLDIFSRISIIFPGKHHVQFSFLAAGGMVEQRLSFIHSKYLASRGMVAVCAQYRTRKSHGAQPFKCLEDAKSAVRYVRDHATELGIDPERIALGGGSPGGHLAVVSSLCLKKFNCPDVDLSITPVANALLLFNPVFDNGLEGYGYDDRV